METCACQAVTASGDWPVYERKTGIHHGRQSCIYGPTPVETVSIAGTCELCGEPMPPGEKMFKYHGCSGPCPSSYKASEAES